MVPIDPPVSRAFSCPEIEYSSVSTDQSFTGGRSLPTRAHVSRSSSPARPSLFQLTIKRSRANSATNSESCGSSAAPAGPDWRATDDAVLKDVHRWVNGDEKFADESFDTVKQIVTEFEEKVQRHKDYDEELDDPETLLRLFSYVEPGLLCPASVPEDKQTQHTVLIGESSKKRMKLISYPSCSSISTGSISAEILRVLESPYSMAACSAKLEKLGFKGRQLLNAIAVLRGDIEAR